MAIHPHLQQPTEEVHQKQEDEAPFQDLNFMEDRQIVNNQSAKYDTQILERNKTIPWIRAVKCSQPS